MESATVLMPLAKQYSAFSQNSIFLKDQNMKKYQHYRYIDAGGGGGGEFYQLHTVVLEKILFFYFKLWQPLCSMEWNIFKILKEGIIRNSQVKLF